MIYNIGQNIFIIKLTVWLKNAIILNLQPFPFNNFISRCQIHGDFSHFIYNRVPNIHTNFQLYANEYNLESLN